MRSLILAAAMLGLAACNTVEGAGKDMELLGGAMTDTAREARDGLEGAPSATQPAAPIEQGAKQQRQPARADEPPPLRVPPS